METDADDPAELEAVVEAAIAAIDEINVEDPVRIEAAGSSRPKELVHAERMSHWLGVLDPGATPAQRLAARAHHLRRWALPRTDYPEGRSGYLRWRADQGRRQADEAAAVLERSGIAPATIERVQAIITKKGRTTDPQVQTHEDALCLVFLELQLDELAERLGEDRTIEVLRKTVGKMSERAISTASEVPLSETGGRLLAVAKAST